MSGDTDVDVDTDADSDSDSDADVDVVVVTYNSADNLAAALEPLPPSANVIVIDNDSSDDSAAIARSLGADVTVNNENLGFGRAATQGARHGSAREILFLNPDASIDADTLTLLVQRLELDPKLAVVSPQMVRPDGSLQRTWWPFPSASRAWGEALRINRWNNRSTDGFVIGACFLIRRSTFETLGGFDERFWLYGEETDLCRRASDAGFRIELADDLRVTHVGGASGAGIEGIVFENFERSGELLVDKYDGRLALVSYRLANLTGAVIRAVLHSTDSDRSLHAARARRIAKLFLRSPLSVPTAEPPAPTSRSR
jgi:N-acetylglucosaminyl-diphospho-decaprenol L-rhamnosyltransferase